MKLLIARLCLLALAAAIVAGAAQAQGAKKVYRVGILSPGAPPPGPLEAFSAGLRERGYVEGRNLQTQWRFAEGRNDRLAGLVDELVAAKVDILFVVNTQAAQAAKKRAGDIPVVFARVSDPSKTGLVASLSRPGGNVTGISNVADELGGKRLEALKTVLPSLSKVAVLWNSGNPGLALILKDAQAAAPQLGMEIAPFGVRTAGELPAAFEGVRTSNAQALFVLDDLLITAFKHDILSLARERKIPVMSLYQEFVEGGGLISYGPSIEEMYRRASWYVDRILRGAKPGDLPVEQPQNFQLVISLKSARELGIAVPKDVLARADKVLR
ncbi:MAG TPA: ABC transporter substrate-binding protein [Burkholderiales bacterium]|nr:ABC transporter substrate-binding protein [Burkholderiales bacterium]